MDTTVIRKKKRTLDLASLCRPSAEASLLQIGEVLKKILLESTSLRAA